MDIILRIFLQVIFPVFLLLGAGVFLHRKYHFDMNTLSKMTTFVLMPTVGFVNIYQSSFTGDLLLTIVLFLVTQNLGLMIFSGVLARAMRLERRVAATFKNSIVLNNSGNYGLSVSQLVFQNNALGLSIQVIVTIFQNLLTHTYGLFNSVSVNVKGSKILPELLKLPIIHAIVLGFILKASDIAIPGFIWKPIENVSNAFLAIALFTLGAQVAYLKLRRPSLPLFLSIFGRLIVSPLLAFLIIYTMGLQGITAQALLIASSYPSSRNTALFALEYDNDPDYAAETVLITTLLSGITVTAVVYMSKVIF
ncbi:AEC family transporter [Cohnella sp.]|uniref:AEC family transporter n=1 Tax=Cohnella sp. TaxID=1883426 RepID=UPI003568C11B